MRTCSGIQAEAGRLQEGRASRLIFSYKRPPAGLWASGCPSPAPSRDRASLHSAPPPPRCVRLHAPGVPGAPCAWVHVIGFVICSGPGRLVVACEMLMDDSSRRTRRPPALPAAGCASPGRGSPRRVVVSLRSGASRCLAAPQRWRPLRHCWPPLALPLLVAAAAGGRRAGEGRSGGRRRRPAEQERRTCWGRRRGRRQQEKGRERKQSRRRRRRRPRRAGGS